jgi:RNA polymerase sigma factor (sigma-70 family)
MHPGRDSRAEARLRGVFEAHYEAVLAYARRRTADLADAEDVVAETFIVVFRRLGDLPVQPDERLPWLFGIARRIALNQQRSSRRRARLHERIRAAIAHSQPPQTALPSVLEAMDRLRETDREILRLVAWEGLSHAEVAGVLGISPNAAAIRLHRARARLAREMAISSRRVKGLDRVRTWLGWKGSTSSLTEREEAR